MQREAIGWRGVKTGIASGLLAGALCRPQVSCPSCPVWSGDYLERRESEESLLERLELESLEGRRESEESLLERLELESLEERRESEESLLERLELESLEGRRESEESLLERLERE